MPYDPRDHGARCNECPLGPRGCLRSQEDEWNPVPPEIHKDAQVLAVGRCPGPEESQIGRPIGGRSASEWAAALSASGKRRPDVDLAYVVECQPPGRPSGAWTRMGKTLDRTNKKRAREGLLPIPHPAACCRPRLLGIASMYDSIILLGRVAMLALTGRNISIQSARGGPIQISEDWQLCDNNARRRALPTLAPAYILRAPAWRGVLHSDIGKAWRWFNDTLRWVDPNILWRPTPEQLESWLLHPAPYWAYDVETDGIIPTECGLRTIAIATPDMDESFQVAKPEINRPIAHPARAVGITLKSVDGEPHYNEATEARIKDILRTAFVDGRTWVGHNAGSTG